MFTRKFTTQSIQVGSDQTMFYNRLNVSLFQREALSKSYGHLTFARDSARRVEAWQEVGIQIRLRRLADAVCRVGISWTIVAGEDATSSVTLQLKFIGEMDPAGSLNEEA